MVATLAFSVVKVVGYNRIIQNTNGIVDILRMKTMV
jgi:hypothetical protein